MPSPRFAFTLWNMTQRSPVDFSVSAGACFAGCLALLLLPLNLVLSIFVAAAIHELAHIVLLCCYRVPILRVEFGIGGAQIHTAPLPPLRELICAAAGPVGSFCCLLFLHRFPLLAVCGSLHGFFNLLPLYPLDGGRMLQCFCQCCCPQWTRPICQTGKWLTITAVSVLSFYLSFRLRDLTFLIAAAYFLLKTAGNEKLLAKRRNIEYNIADF